MVHSKQKSFLYNIYWKQSKLKIKFFNISNYFLLFSFSINIPDRSVADRSALNSENS